MRNNTLKIITVLALGGGALFLISKSGAAKMSARGIGTEANLLQPVASGGFNGFNPSGELSATRVITDPSNDFPLSDILAPITQRPASNFPTGIAPPPRVTLGASLQTVNPAVRMNRSPINDSRQAGTGSSPTIRRQLR